MRAQLKYLIEKHFLITIFFAVFFAAEFLGLILSLFGVFK